jgi:glutathione S-transferase
LIIEKATPLDAYLDHEVGQKKFLVGDRLNMADITLTARFISAALGRGLINEKSWPNLASNVNEQFAGKLFAPIISRSQRFVAKMLAELRNINSRFVCAVFPYGGISVTA